MTGQLFISHAHDDAAAAARIMAYLEAHGVACWISSRDIPPRAIYADAITEAMLASSGCAVLITGAANQSKAVKREVELASHYNKPFIPIRVNGSEPGAGLDYYLRNTQWVDYARDGERALDRIVGALQGGPTPVSSFAPTRRTPRIPIVVGVVLLVAAAGRWLAWTRWGGPATAETPFAAAGAAAELVGSYNWQGLPCGDGPTVTLENGVLVFAMPGTPTYRHSVLSAESNADGYALRVETRVTAPPESTGQMYTLGLHRDMDRLPRLDVITRGRTDSWDRCPDRPAPREQGGTAG
jgi:TIR domain